MTKKVLIYSPYGEWHFHGMYDITIGHGLRVRGTEVKYICCDGCFSDCDVHWDATAPRNEQSCQSCSNLNKSLCDGMQMPFDWLSLYLPVNIQEKATSWVANLPDAELFSAKFRNYPLGRWVKSSVHSHFRMNQLNLNDPRVNSAYRSYLASAFVAMHGAENLLDEVKPDAVLMLNGRFFSHRVFFELARARGIRVLVHERGSRVNALRFWENENCHSYQTFLTSWKAWKDIPLDESQLGEITRILEEREHGKNTGWKSFASPKQELDQFREKLGIQHGEKVVSMYTSSDDEMAASEGWETVMDQLDWINRSISFFSDRPEYVLVIRIHPNTAGINGSNEQFIQQIAQLTAKGLANNIRIIPAQEKINSYQLMDISERCIVFSSTVSMEAVARGKPVLMTGGGWNYGNEFSENLVTNEDYEKTLNGFLQKEISTQEIRYAIRFAYHQFCRYSIPFPLVDGVEVFLAKNNYKSLDELLPGKDEALDLACEYLLEGKPIYGAPSKLTNRCDEAETREVDKRMHPDQIGTFVSVKQDDEFDFSVIVPTYNRSGILKKCLDALSAQSYPCDKFEVIVCDDGSQDDTSDVIRHYQAPFSLSYLVQNNSGPAKARNMGIRKARGKYLLILNDDAITDIDLLESHAKEHANLGDAKVAVLGSFPFLPERTKNPFGYMLENSDLLFYFNRMKPNEFYDYNHFYTCNISISRQAVINAGMFDEDFFVPAAEDIELGYRLQMAGYRVYYAPHCRAWHDHSITAKGFCRVQEVRGVGAAILYEKYPELSAIKGDSLEFFENWKKHNGMNPDEIEQFLVRLEELNNSTQDANPDSLRKVASAMHEPTQFLSHYFWLKGIAKQKGNTSKAGISVSNEKAVTKKTPDVLISVIITCYNYARYVEEAVYSVLVQTYKNFEIIIVNDGSTDNSLEVIQNILHENPGRNIRLVDQANSGQPAISRNNGIKLAQGKYIICLDADDKLASTMLADCVEMLEHNPDIAIAYTDRLDFDGVDQVVLADEFDPQKLRYQNQISYCALYRKEVWESVGGYRTNVRGVEDWDFWVAASAKGFVARRIAKPLLMYRRHDTGLYQHALQNIDEKIANIFLNNKELYSEPEISAAKKIIQDLENKNKQGGSAMSNQPLVSVIVPTFNRPDLLRNALESVLQQDYDNWEVIVINDAGQDVENLVLSLDPKGRIHYLKHEKNKGLPAARNTALGASKGEIICYLDDDDEYRPDHISTIVNAFRDRNELLVYTDAEYVYEKMGTPKKEVIGSDRRYEDMEYSKGTLYTTNYIPVNSWAHKRELMDIAGVFDETFSAFEDWELLLRYSNVTDFYHVRKATVNVIHRTDDKTMTDKQKINYPDLLKKIYQMYPTDSDEINNMRNIVLVTAKKEAAEASQAGFEESDKDRYRDWIELHQLSQLDVDLMCSRVYGAASRPGIHLLVVAEQDDFEELASLIDTLSSQLYKDWGLSIFSRHSAPDVTLKQLDMVEWVEYSTNLPQVINQEIERVSADWLAILPVSGRLEIHTLLRAADYIIANEDWKYIYTDHDVVNEDGVRESPFFKPGFSIDLLRSMNFIGGFAVVNRNAVQKVGGFVEVGVLSNYDMAFRVVEKFGENAIGHIEDILFHELKIPHYDETSQKEIIQAHLSRSGLKATIGDAFIPGAFYIEYIYPEQPLVSVIVPTRNKLEYLQPCLDSLLQRTEYQNYELLVVDNDSDDPDVHSYLDNIQHEYQGKINRVNYPGEFNFAALINHAVAHSRGEYILILHNDTEILQGKWLDRMISIAVRDDVGIVGARSLSPGTGKVQHAGYVLGKSSIVDSFYSGTIDIKNPGYHGLAQVVQEVSAVSSACMLVRKSIYEKLGGMNADEYGLVLNDVDLCLRARQQHHKVIWTPFSSILHHGGVSTRDNGRDLVLHARLAIEREKEQDAFLRKYARYLGNDPFFNRHLSLVSNDVKVEHQAVCNWDVNFHELPRVYGAPLSGGSGEYRIKAPFRMLERKAVCQCDSAVSSKVNVQRFPSLMEVSRLDPDVIVFHAPIGDDPINALSKYKKYTDMDIVFTMDDLLTNLPEGNPFRKIAPRDARSRLREALSYTDRLIVTTEPLRQLCENMIDNIHVIPNYLENEIWGSLNSERGFGKKPRVGWAGAQQHGGDLEFIFDVVRETANEVEWVFFGMCPDEIKPYIAEEHKFEKSFNLYAQKLASLNLDLAIAPLEYHPFNEAKSNLRLLEYGVFGWPVICTDIYPYQNAPVKCLGNDKLQWINAIRERIYDLESAYREGDALRQWVLKSHMLNDHVDEWKHAILGDEKRGF